MKIAAVVLTVGILVAIVVGSVEPTDLGNLIALVLGGVASVLLLCLAFYAVGRSEDRDREQQAAKSPRRGG
jgi:uncharacterized membrane protein (DUF441 family)